MTEAVEYRIDAADTITEVGGAWEAFSEANGGAGEVVGHPLWHFVTGADVCATWRLLLRRVRQTKGSIAFPYRCDAPGLRRLMQMELSSGTAATVLFRSTEADVAEAPTYNGTWVASGTQSTVSVCGWCGHVRLARWVPPEEAVAELGLLGGPGARLSHGICESCAQALSAKVSEPALHD